MWAQAVRYVATFGAVAVLAACAQASPPSPAKNPNAHKRLQSYEVAALGRALPVHEASRPYQLADVRPPRPPRYPPPPPRRGQVPPPPRGDGPPPRPTIWNDDEILPPQDSEPASPPKVETIELPEERTEPKTASESVPDTTPDLVEGSTLNLRYPRRAPQPDDVAVLIGNGDYTSLGKDIPNVSPAHADIQAFKAFATQALGVKPGNVIELKDATHAQLVRVFGNATNPKGQLYDWVKSRRSRVYIYYSGHGAPDQERHGSYLVPVDADGTRIDLNGYALSTLYRNLDQLEARSISVVLEACFSGNSEAGPLAINASPIYVKEKTPQVPKDLTVIAATAPGQIASWAPDKSHGLFTKYYLTGMSGEADKTPYGNGDGLVDLPEIKAYLDETLTYFARRHYSRDQTATVFVNGSPLP